MTRTFMKNNESFDRLFNAPVFYKTFMKIMAKKVYKIINKKID